jgi:hypothetical protein
MIHDVPHGVYEQSRLAVTEQRVGFKPVPTTQRVGFPGLLRIKHCTVPLFGFRVHPGAVGELDCRLGATVKHDEQWQPLRGPDSGRQVQPVGQVALPWQAKAASAWFIKNTRQPLTARTCVSGAATLRA